MEKTVFITGASSGFGESCARRFSKESYKLILAARRTEKLKSLQEQLGGPKQVHIITLDIRDRKRTDAELKKIPSKFQDIDILVNNAGLALGLEPAHRTDPDEWETMVDTNIKGLIFCTQILLPGMVERGRGHIVNIGSIAGSWPYPGGNVYGATKAFVKQFSNNLRADLGGTGIRVTNIEPGLAESEFSVVRFGGDVKKAADVYKGTEPLVPEDIADTVFWAATRPSHVNINSIELMPTCQSWGPFNINRR